MSLLLKPPPNYEIVCTRREAQALGRGRRKSGTEPLISEFVFVRDRKAQSEKMKREEEEEIIEKNH